MRRDTPSGKPRRLGLFAGTMSVLAHLVGQNLGIRALSAPTLYAGVLTLLIALPLISGAAQTIVEALVAWSLGSVDDWLISAVNTAVLLLVALGLGAWTALRLRVEAKYEDLLVERRHGPGEANQTALLFSCSRLPGPEWMEALVAMNPTGRNEAAHHPPVEHRGARWLGLLHSSLAYHGRFLDRLILLVDQTALDDRRRQALTSLASAIVADLPDRDRGPLQQLELLELRDVNDAEVVRSQIVGCLSELRELVPSSDHMAVQITGGTAAMSVGLVLAASIEGVEVLYFRQDEDVAQIPVHVETDRARRRIHEWLTNQWSR